MNSTISTEDFQLLSAYLDGELDAAEQQRLEARFASEPALARTLSELHEQQARLCDTVAGAASADRVPAHIRALLEPRGKVVPMTPRRGGYWRSRGLPRLAVAASLVAAIGLLALPRWQQAPDSAALLTAALDNLPSQASGWHPLDDGRRIRPVLSFPHQNGQWCREYLLADDQEYRRGIACRERDTRQWQTAISVAYQPADESHAYRPASARDQDDVAQWMADHAADIALGARAEAALIGRHWQE